MVICFADTSYFSYSYNSKSFDCIRLKTSGHIRPIRFFQVESPCHRARLSCLHTVQPVYWNMAPSPPDAESSAPHPGHQRGSWETTPPIQLPRGQTLERYRGEELWHHCLQCGGSRGTRGRYYRVIIKLILQSCTSHSLTSLKNLQISSLARRCRYPGWLWTVGKPSVQVTTAQLWRPLLSRVRSYSYRTKVWPWFTRASHYCIWEILSAGSDLLLLPCLLLLLLPHCIQRHFPWVVLQKEWPPLTSSSSVTRATVRAALWSRDKKKKTAMKTPLMTQNGGRGRVWPRTQKTKYCSQRRGQDRRSAQTRGETGGASPLTLTHLYVQRAVLIKRAGVVDTQQHFIIPGRQLPFGGEGCHVSCGENRSATRFPRTLTPRSSGKALTCRVDADAPVDLVLSEKLQGKRPSVARSIRVYDIKPDGRRLLIAETGCPLLDHRTVVILV